MWLKELQFCLGSEHNIMGKREPSFFPIPILFQELSRPWFMILDDIFVFVQLKIYFYKYLPLTFLCSDSLQNHIGKSHLNHFKVNYFSTNSPYKKNINVEQS